MGWSSVISRARGGCRQSFDVLTRGCWGYLIVAARERLPGDLRVKVAPSDLVQQTLLVGFANIGEFEGRSEGDLLRWLEKILDNQALSTGRYYRGTQAREINREISVERLVSPPAAEAATPSEVIVREEERRRLEKELSELPEHYRSIIFSRSLEELSFEEIGRRTGRSADAARKLWVAALRFLKERISEDDESDFPA